MGKSSRRKRKTSGKIALGGDGSESLYRCDTGLSQQNAIYRTRKVDYYLAASVSVVTFLAYLFSLQNEFVLWDDDHYVYLNQHIRSINMDFFRWAFFDFYGSNWHPLTWISHAVDYAFWGLNPLGHHLTNNITHSINSFLVVVLLIKLLEIYKERVVSDGSTTFIDRSKVLMVGGVTGLLFGLHPVHVESVAWVAERKDLLCGLFFLLTILSYTRYLSSEAARDNIGIQLLSKEYLISLVFFVLALMSKPMAVSIPAVLLILDWYPFQRVNSLKTFCKAFIEKLPFIAFSLISSILTILAQQTDKAMQLMDFVPLSTRLAVAVKSLVSYLWKIILPLNLIPYYPYPPDVSFLSPLYLLPILLVIGITILCFSMVGKEKMWLSVWGYYVVTLLPVLGLVQVGGQSMADRYTYLPSLGPFLVAGLAITWIWKRLQTRTLFLKYLSAVTATFILLCMSFLTVKQIEVWNTSISLWNYVIERQPQGVSLAYYNRGTAFGKRGNLDKAMEDFDKAIALNPSYAEAYSNRGIVLGKRGNLDKAMEDFDKAIALSPSYASAYYNRGVVNGEIGHSGNEIADFQKACDLGDREGCRLLQTLTAR